MRINTKVIPVILLLLFAARAIAATVVVDNVDDLAIEIHNLSDGDTLLIKAGTYQVTPDLAPDGLYVAGKDFQPYKDVTILGEGQGQTIIDFNDSYGFLAVFCDNLIFKDLTIKNATLNGGIYVYDGDISVKSVTIQDCKSIVHHDRNSGDGGAICVDESSTIRLITNSIFKNNSAEDNGGAIALMGKGTAYSISPKIDQCQFYNNTSGGDGAAVYYYYLQKTSYFYRNTIFANNATGKAAVFFNGTSTLYFKHNSIVKNKSEGLYVGAGMAARFRFNNNAVIDNDKTDCLGAGSSNVYEGQFNLLGTSSNVSYVGYYNDIVSNKHDLYAVNNDVLEVTTYGAGLLAGRVPKSKSFSSDVNGDAWSKIGDIGALKVPLGDSVSVWIGATNDFALSSNWLGSVPTAGKTKKIIVSNCLTEDYPQLATGTSLNVPGADMYICATGALLSAGTLTVDTLFLESQNGGTAQFLSQGTLNSSARLSEQYLDINLCSPVYFPDTITIVKDLLPGATYDADYCLKSFNEGDLTYNELQNTDTLFQYQGYWVESKKNQTMTFSLPPSPKEEFELQHTDQDKDLEEGWNIIGNPYGAPITSEKMMANAGNSDIVASAVYSFSDGHFKAYVDSVGDVEAKVVMPYKAFYLKALDQGSAAVETSTFKLNAGNAEIKTSEEIDELALKPEMMKISLYDNASHLIDKTYIRFKGESTDAFDNASDAYKLDCMFGLGSEYIYTMMPYAEEVYAINTLPIAADEIKSMPIKLLRQVESKVSRVLKFEISEDAEVEYLLHDSETDSSKSVILASGSEYTFTTNDDSTKLSDRFSLQIFEDTIPYGILSVKDDTTQGYYFRERQRIKSYEDKEVISEMLSSEAILDNPDTIFYEQEWVDTVYYDSISYQVNYHDSIVIDSFISDTLRVLGTYEYVITKVKKKYTTHTVKDTVYLDTVSLKREEYYTKYDTVLVASTEDVAAQDLVKIINIDGGLRLRFMNAEATEVKLYNLSGQVLRKARMYEQGDLQQLSSGVYLLTINNTHGHRAYRVLIK